MKLPQTIKGYMSLLKKIETELCPSELKGFDKLPVQLQEDIRELDAAMSNFINEWGK